MKQIILLTITSFFTISLATAQQYALQKKQIVAHDVYLEAFEMYLRDCKDCWTQGSPVYVEFSHFITEHIPDTIQNRFIVKVGNSDIRRLTNRKKPINMLRVLPLRIKDNALYITIIDFKVSYKKKNFNFVNQGGKNYTIRYDCENKMMFLEGN